ncbi:hypothetical protein ETAA8_58460 [Anatilimnocola aggregata]|uniref:DUF4064 domain-containing protein n=1 Tax=Anatilimnocola aggregata TaxID=2528021 RepID=A0A517YKF5_9BACT|nr:hypothetical protein [Anatilimnocola aggregata]QDU30698.1 hypothetical protein ETAA8_58460 [Anatilimnocola aggregata]
MVPESHNPYQSPVHDDAPETILPGGLSPATLLQQRVICVLLIIHGLLTLMMGGMYIVSAFVIPDLMYRGNGPDDPRMDQMKSVLVISYVCMASGGLIAGVLQIYAGIRNFWLRGYRWGLAALGSLIVGGMTCYCLPTGLAILIYGLIIYLSPTTRHAFELAKRGLTYQDLAKIADAGGSGPT